MQHSSNRNFGVPLPFSARNPYGISARAALEGLISVPEGPLETAEAALVKPWLDALSKWLLQRGVSIYFFRQLTPMRKFKPSAMSFYVTRALALPLQEFDKANPPPTLEQIAATLQALPEGPDTLYALIGFLEEHLEARELAALQQRYPCLRMGN